MTRAIIKLEVRFRPGHFFFECLWIVGRSLSSFLVRQVGIRIRGRRVMMSLISSHDEKKGIAREATYVEKRKAATLDENT